MATRARPWATRYLLFAAWSQHEFRNLLCGFSPSPPEDTPVPAASPVPTRKEIADTFVGEELRRVVADRHIQDAILAGDLKVLDPPDEQLLAKIRPVVAPDELEALRRAIAHDRTCNKAYRVSRDAAVRWAVRRRDLFPAFPFTLDDLRPAAGGPTAAGPASLELKEHRRRLLKRALGGKSQTAFCRDHKAMLITMDILRAVIAGNARRADVGNWTPKILALLEIEMDEWNTAS